MHVSVEMHIALGGNRIMLTAEAIFHELLFSHILGPEIIVLSDKHFASLARETYSAVWMHD